MTKKRARRIGIACLLACSAAAMAGDGPLGIDHRWSYDDSGIWKRSNQNILRYAAA